MALSISTFDFSLVLGCLILATTSNASSSKENQFCGNQMFYCPTNGQCLDRKLRCNESRVCVDSYGNEPKCFESSITGTYNYFKKTASLSSSRSSSRKKRSIFDKISHLLDYELKHWFVEYRGFVYEFGSYGFQELDVNDPNYKYGPGGEEVLSEEFMGNSFCTRDQVLRFVNKWLHDNPDYTWYDNNCQDFAKQLLDELAWGCTRVDTVSLDTVSLKATSKCATSSSFRWRVHSLFALLISLAILHNIN